MPARSRVSDNTSPELNRTIHQQIENSIEYYAGHPGEIPQRLKELEREWDIERVLETGSSTLSLLGLSLALTINRRWLILPIAVQAFFFQHALQGWCPPLPLFRRLGVRTTEEIDSERFKLQALLNELQQSTSYDISSREGNETQTLAGSLQVDRMRFAMSRAERVL